MPISRCRCFVAAALAVAVGLAGCGASASSVPATASSARNARQAVTVSLGSSFVPGMGGKLYERLFDLLLDEVTTDRVQLRDAVIDTTFVPDLHIAFDSLQFDINAESDRLTVGALVEGRQFLQASIRYVVRDGATGAQVAAGEASAQTILARQRGVPLETYIGVLGVLAADVTRRVGLPSPPRAPL